MVSTRWAASAGRPEIVIFGIAGITACSVLLIMGFIGATAAPVLMKEGLGFLTGTVWNFESGSYGIVIYFLGTLVLALLTLVLAIPLGLLTAVYLAEWAPARLEQVLRPAIELLVGIPSVVFGIFALFVLEPFFRDFVDPAIANTLGVIPWFHNDMPQSGATVLLAACVLAIMVMPTIVVLSQEAMKSVPQGMKEASLALGATRWETMRGIVFPVAFPGIVTGIILALMRAMGETMAVAMILGGTSQIPSSVLGSAYPMTVKILNDINFWIAMDEPRSALFGIAFVLLILEIGFVGIIRAISVSIRRRMG